MMEPMICETFLQFRYLSDLGLSPDGRYTAYIRQQANLASNGYDARLWVYDHSTGADRPLSSLSPVRAFSWMDNRTILFSGMRGTAGSASQDTTTYYALPVDGRRGADPVHRPHAGGQGPALNGRAVRFHRHRGHEPPKSGQSESLGGSFGPGGIQKPHL